MSAVAPVLNKARAHSPRPIAVSLVLGLLAMSVGSAMWFVGAFDTLDNAYLDLQTRVLQQEQASEVAIVEIDARTLKELGQWPLPRALHGHVVRSLHAVGVKALFVDIDFSSASSANQDAQLAAALRDVSADSHLILPAFWQPATNDASGLLFSAPLPQFRAHAELGLVNLVPGRDGLVREISSFSELPGQAVPVWRRLNPSTAHRETLRIDFRQSPSSFDRYSYVDIVRDGASDRLRNKIVFLGATALELGDIVAVPIHRALPGVVVQAMAHDSALHDRLAIASNLSIALGMTVWSLFATWLLAGGSWRRSPLVAALLIAAVLVLAPLAYAKLDLVVPVSPFVVVTLIALMGSLLTSLSAETWRAWRAMRRTREQDALLRQVVDQSSDAILTLDSNGVIRTANRASQRILACPATMLVGRPLDDCAPILHATLSSLRVDTPIEIWLDGDARSVAVEVSRAELEWDDEQITTLTLHDVTAQRRREAELRHMALHDGLTGLPNRVSLAKQLETTLGTRKASDLVALMMLDLDGFKEVNDTLGHSMGDELMRELGRRFEHLATQDRHISRVGGDEFAVLWRCSHVDEIGELAQQLLLIVEEPIVIKGIPVSLGTSIGIALCPHHAEDSESLLKRADVALYVAKRKHTGVEFYEPSDDTHSPRRLEMLTLLRAAVGNDELALEYQPKVAIASGMPVEVEALCRWHSPTLGQVSPAEFVPLAEASDVIKQLTEWTIRKALSDCRMWHERGVNLRVAVNLSARHLQDAHLPKWLEATFEATNTRPEWLELEITESAIMSDPDRASKVLHALHELGVLLSIDDFGTGYSSLAYLRNLAVDRLKLDRSFINNMNEGAKEQVIVESTIKLAHGLDLEIVAEGIETEHQLELLRRFGCDLGQGYWIARPMRVEQLIAWFQTRSMQTHAAKKKPVAIGVK